MAGNRNRRKFVASDLVCFPSLIWYCPRTVDCNEAIFAYGHFSNVVLVNILESCPRLIGLISFPDRIVALQFAKSDSSLLAVGDASGNLRVFKVLGDSYTEKRFTRIKGLHALEWSNSPLQSVYVATESNWVTEWHAFQKQKKLHKFSFLGCIMNMAANPRKSHILAIALKNGNVYIVDMSTDTRVHFLDPQPVSVVIDLFWSSYSEKLFTCYKSGQLRVSTILEDNNISDKAYQVSSITKEENGQKKKSKRAMHATVWCHAAEHPADPRFILVCSSRGNVGMINIEEENSTIQYMENNLRRSNKMMFVIVKRSKDTFFTYSKDFLLTIWDINKMQAINEIPTLNNHIRTIAFSPYTYGKMSVASSEPVIMSWNINVPPPQYNMHFAYTSSPAESCQITCIAWHPEKEILGFGTIKGKVGYIDENRKYLQFKACHTNQITRLSWGPCSLLDTVEETENTKLFLYSCGAGSICIHDPDSIQKRFIDLDTLLHPSKNTDEQIDHREICWKPDYSQFAVGNKDEIINIYDGRTFHCIFHLQVTDYVNVIRWHRTHIFGTESLSPFHNWLAVGSESRIVNVFDTGELEACADGTVPLMSVATKQLRGHTKYVTALEWSIADEELLASCSGDCTVKVWNVALGLLIVNFTGHCKIVNSLAWNLLDKDMIFSGGADATLIGWKLSDQPELSISAEEEQASNTSKQKKKEKGVGRDHVDEKVNDHNKENNESTVSGSDAIATSEGPLTRRSKRHRLLQKLFAEADVTSKAMSQQHEIVEELEVHADNDKQETVQPSCSQSSKPLFEFLYPKKMKENESALVKGIVAFDSKVRSGSREPFIAKPELRKINDYFFSLLGSKREVFTLINALLDDWNQYLKLVGMKPKVLKEKFIFCILLSKFDTLTGFIFSKLNLDVHPVAMAPMVSRSYMLEVLQRYVAVASSVLYKPIYPIFIMATHGIQAALRYLIGKRHYTNAYVLAKYYLPKSDTLAQEIFNRLFQALQTSKNFTDLAIYLCNENNLFHAARLITKLNTVQAFQVAAGLCAKCEESVKAKSYSTTCLTKGLLAGETKHVISMLYEQDLKDLIWVVVVYSCVVSHVEMLKTESDLFGLIEENTLNQKTAKEYTLWQKYSVEGKKFLRHMYDILVRENLFDASSTQFLDTYSIWRNAHKKRTTVSSINEAVYFITVSICNFFYVLFTDGSERKFESAVKELSSALEICSNSQLPSELRAMCLLLLPFDITWSEETAIFEVKMHVEPEGNIIDEVYEWLEKEILLRNMFNQDISVYEIMNKEGSMCKKYDMDELEQALLSASVTDVIIMIFASCLANEISLGKFELFLSFICTKESHCNDSKHDRKTEEIINSQMDINDQSNCCQMLGETSLDTPVISSNCANLTSDVSLLNQKESKNSHVEKNQDLEDSQLKHETSKDLSCSRTDEVKEEEYKEDIENSSCSKHEDVEKSDLIENKSPINYFGMKTENSKDIFTVNNIPVCVSNLDIGNLKNSVNLKNGDLNESSNFENENSSDPSILKNEFSKSSSDLQTESSKISCNLEIQDLNNSPSLKNDDSKDSSTLENDVPTDNSIFGNKVFKNNDSKDSSTLETDPNNHSAFEDCTNLEIVIPEMSHDIGSEDLNNSSSLKTDDSKDTSTLENEDPNRSSNFENKIFEMNEMSHDIGSGDLNNSSSLKTDDSKDTSSLENEYPNRSSTFENKVFETSNLGNGSSGIAQNSGNEDLNNFPNLENEPPNGPLTSGDKNSSVLGTKVSDISHSSDNEELNNSSILANDNLEDFSILGDVVSNSCSGLIDVGPKYSPSLENKNSGESHCLKNNEDHKVLLSQIENSKKSSESFENEDINNGLGLENDNPEHCVCLEQSKKLFDVLNNIVGLICRDIYKVNPSMRRFILKKPIISTTVQDDSTTGESLSSKENVTERFFLHEKIKHYQEFTFLLSLVKTKGQVTHFPNVFAACDRVVSCFVKIREQSVCDHVKSEAKLLEDLVISWRDNKFN